MLITRSILSALLDTIKTPRNGSYELRDGRVYLIDKKHGDKRPVCLKNGRLAVLEDS